MPRKTRRSRKERGGSPPGLTPEMLKKQREELAETETSGLNRDVFNRIAGKRRRTRRRRRHH